MRTAGHGPQNPARVHVTPHTARVRCHVHRRTTRGNIPSIIVIVALPGPLVATHADDTVAPLRSHRRDAAARAELRLDLQLLLLPLGARLPLVVPAARAR